jgi:hypothetical protein
MNFRMGFPCSFMPPLADELTLLNQHTTHTRIGRGGVETFFSQSDGSRHPLGILFLNRIKGHESHP